MTSLELLLCTVLIAISAYMSASEIALFSLSRFQIRSMRERVRSGHRKIKRLLADPSGLLITILVVNEVVNIAISTLVTGAVSRSFIVDKTSTLAHLPLWAARSLVGILITAPVVLFFCEITPKVLAARANQLVAALTIGSLSAIYDAMKPVRAVLQKFTSLISRWSGQSDQQGSDVLKESEFMLMLEEGHKEGAIQENELELIRNVFELDDTTISEVYTPIGQVRTISTHTTLKGALVAIREHKYSRIPVTGDHRKEVIGILHLKDLLRAKLNPELESMTVATVMRKPLYVPPSMRLNALFRKFKQQQLHMAVVQGPQRETLGVVTMDDVLDELFEDLLPPGDRGVSLK